MIYINGRFLTQNLTGVQRYALEIVKNIDKKVKKGEVVLLCPNVELINKISLNNITIKKIGKFKGQIWEQISLPFYIKKDDVLLNLCNLAPILKPSYVTIHDLSFKTNIGHLSKRFVMWYKFVMKMNIKRYKHIFTVSNFSKNEIISNYNIDDEKISITYNSADHLNGVKEDLSILKKYKLEKNNYYFSLGSNSKHKNFEYIYKLAVKYPKIMFVVTGSNNTKIFNDNNNISLDNLIYTGYLCDNEMAALYSNCKAFIFPSLYEGFGIPPLEAVKMGCKHLILSDIEVLKEVYGDNAVYLDTKVDYVLPKEMVCVESKELLSKYSWDKSASIILDTIVHRNK